MATNNTTPAAPCPRGNIPHFNPKEINLELWLSLLEAHFLHLNISDDVQKRSTLLVSVGTEVYQILGNLCSPEYPHTQSYDDLVLKLKQHFVVKPSYHRSLINFQKRVKKPDETLQSLYVDLKPLPSIATFRPNLTTGLGTNCLWQ